MGSVPDCHNKGESHEFFWYPTAYNIYIILWPIKCAVSLCLKTNVHIII